MKEKSFNPRSHMGSDIRDLFFFLPIFSFNPRSHMGSDFNNHTELNGLVDVSIHAPTWGATCRWFIHQAKAQVSIHAPTWGATAMPLSIMI